MRRFQLPLLIGGCALLALPARLAAESVRLKDGRTLEARRVTLVGDRLVLELDLGGGTGTLKLPLERVEPGDRVRLLAARTSDADAPGQLRLAASALEAGLFAQAEGRARAAAALAPKFAEAADALLAELAVRRVQAELSEIELDLRLARPLAARERARRLLSEEAQPGRLEALVARARLLLALAEQALKPAPGAGPLAAPLPVAPPGPAGPPAALPAPPGGAPVPGAAPQPGAAAVDDAALLTQRAVLARERAADPALPAPQREVHLLAAAEQLLHARRVLQAVTSGDALALTQRLDGLRALLLATWLDLADLARGAGAFGVALDRVQAALVLEPESPRAWELRGWVEADLAAQRVPWGVPPVSFEGAWGRSLSPFVGPRWGRACGCAPPASWRGAPRPPARHVVGQRR